MLTALVISGTGLIGSALVARLTQLQIDFIATSRRNPSIDRSALYLDLEKSWLTILPVSDVVFLVAGMPGFAVCNQNPVQTYRVNVDGPLEIAHRKLGFPVFVSSDCVEWSHDSYAWQKRQVETDIRLLGGAVVRPTRIVPERAAEFCEFLVDIGMNHRVGTHLWTPRIH